MSQTLHASAVAVEERGLLILGDSGTGKSALAIACIARGAALVADDRVILSAAADGLCLAAPDPIRGLIEARGVGLIRCPAREARLHVAVTLDRPATGRLPRIHKQVLLGRAVPTIMGAGREGLADVLMLLLRGGRLMDPDQGELDT